MANLVDQLQSLILSAIDLGTLTDWPDPLIEDYLNILRNIALVAGGADDNSAQIEINKDNIAINALQIAINVTDIAVNAANIAINAGDIAELKQTFSWKIIPTGEEVTIGVNQQMIVADGIDIDGSLVIDGELSLI